MCISVHVFFGCVFAIAVPLFCGVLLRPVVLG